MKFSILFFILFNSVFSIACSCWEVQDRPGGYYSFFEKNTQSIIGKILEVKESSDEIIFEVEIINSLRSSIKNGVHHFVNKKIAGCNLSLNPNEIYLLTPQIIDNKWFLETCSFILSNKAERFHKDTSLIMMFAKNNFEIDCDYFKVKMDNGKRVGVWNLYDAFNDSVKSIIETGFFINGNRNGEWINKGTYSYWDNGKFIKRIEYLNDTIKMIEFENQYLMYYPNGNVLKKIDYSKKKYFVYDIKGNVIECARYNKKDILYNWFKFDVVNKTKHKILTEEGNDYFVSLEFYKL